MYTDLIAAACDDDWLEFDGRCYYISNADNKLEREDTTWRRSRDQCLTAGGDLVTIMTIEERRWLLNIVNKSFTSRISSIVILMFYK